jgi:hypothetical protein
MAIDQNHQVSSSETEKERLGNEMRTKYLETQFFSFPDFINPKD